MRASFLAVPSVGRVYASVAGHHELAIVDATSLEVRSRLKDIRFPDSIAYAAEAGKVFVSDESGQRDIVVDARGDSTRKVIPLGDHPHGFYIDAPHRLAFVSCEGNARLLVVDLTTMQVTGSHPVGKDPDVLAFDPGLARLYVAAESGVVTVFEEQRAALRPLGEYRASAAHSVSVDPISHRVYLPLSNVGGRPVLRVLAPLITPR